MFSMNGQSLWITADSRGSGPFGRGTKEIMEIFIGRVSFIFRVTVRPSIRQIKNNHELFPIDLANLSTHMNSLTPYETMNCESLCYQIMNRKPADYRTSDGIILGT